MTDETPPAQPQHLADDLLVLLADGECDERERGLAEAHLAVCQACSEREEVLVATTHLAATPVEQAPQLVLARQLRTALAAAHVAEPSSARHPRHPRRLLARGSLAAAAVITIAGGALVTVKAIENSPAPSTADATLSPLAVSSGAATAQQAVSSARGAAIVQIRRLTGKQAGASCLRVSQLPPGKAVTDPDLVDSAHRPDCVRLGPALVTIRAGVVAREHGPSNRAGPYTLTVDLSAGDARKLALGTPPPGGTYVLVGDGAADGGVAPIRLA
jgi:hypothetical protein